MSTLGTHIKNSFKATFIPEGIYDVRFVFTSKLFVGGIMFNLRYLCLLLCFCSVFLRLAYPVSLDFPFLIAVLYLYLQTLEETCKIVDIKFTAHARFWKQFQQVSAKWKDCKAKVLKVFGSKKTKRPKQDIQNRLWSHIPEVGEL